MKKPSTVLPDNQTIMSQFTKGLFWSYDINKLDYKKHKKLIIEQVIEAGNARSNKGVAEYSFI